MLASKVEQRLGTGETMRRREFIALMGASVAWPLAAMAQQLDDMRRIAVLMGFPNDAQGQARVTVIRQELLKLGWAVGRNAHIDIRWAAGDPALTQTYAAELIQLKPDVIIANSSLGVSALLRATSHNSCGLHGGPRSGRARIC